MDTSNIKEAEKIEFDLKINDFSNANTTAGIMTTVKMIKHLILLEPKTYPNHPDMGVGIKNYLFDRITHSKLQEITSAISTQITKFLPNVIINNLQIEILDNLEGAAGQTLGVLLEVTASNSISYEVIYLLKKNHINDGTDTRIFVNGSVIS